MAVFCSTIIPTVNRPTLGRAVASVLDQSLEATRFEVIVVNDSGTLLDPASWQEKPNVTVLHTNRRERSVARNAGAAAARGRYLHFLDDDDVMLPGALEAFWRLSLQKPEAVWLYGSYQTVDNEANVLQEWHPGLEGNIFALTLAGESIPLQASLLDASAFFRAGAFDPTMSACEDRDLGRRICLRDDVAYARVVVAQIRIGEAGSSTDWSRLAENDRWGREKALDSTGAVARLRRAGMSSYVNGRVCRAFIASTVWNLRRRRVATAMTRIGAGFTLAGSHLFSAGFWRGLRKVHLGGARA
jgi:glycosyltransferase involved in cell wall biosynthesis